MSKAHLLDLFALKASDRLRRAIGSLVPRRIVTLHHLACSGGTIITKCLATMPQAMVLSEIHPKRAAQPAYHALSQLGRGYGKLLDQDHQTLIEGHFRREILIAHNVACSLGRQLIVRDHAHVDFAWHGYKRSALLESLSREFQVSPIVTIRDPREVWISLRREGWFDGTPDDLCRAQLDLLDAFPGSPVFRYEDFTINPAGIVKEICSVIGLQYIEGFEERLGAVTHLTGDSGRKGEVIAPREPKPLSKEERLLFEKSNAFLKLVERQALKV